MLLQSRVHHDHHHHPHPHHHHQPGAKVQYCIAPPPSDPPRERTSASWRVRPGDESYSGFPPENLRSTSDHNHHHYCHHTLDPNLCNPIKKKKPRADHRHPSADRGNPHWGRDLSLSFFLVSRHFDLSDTSLSSLLLLLLLPVGRNPRPDTWILRICAPPRSLRYDT